MSTANYYHIVYRKHKKGTNIVKLTCIVSVVRFLQFLRDNRIIVRTSSILRRKIRVVESHPPWKIRSFLFQRSINYETYKKKRFTKRIPSGDNTNSTVNPRRSVDMRRGRRTLCVKWNTEEESFQRTRRTFLSTETTILCRVTWEKGVVDRLDLGKVCDAETTVLPEGRCLQNIRRLTVPFLLNINPMSTFQPTKKLPRNLWLYTTEPKTKIRRGRLVLVRERGHKRRSNSYTVGNLFLWLY